MKILNILLILTFLCCCFFAETYATEEPEYVPPSRVSDAAHKHTNDLDKVKNDGHNHAEESFVMQYFGAIWRMNETIPELKNQTMKVFIVFILLTAYRLTKPEKFFKRKGQVKNV